jgi:glucosamine--fructose-6-phosphate aminotransferase (isomerizing)
VTAPTTDSVMYQTMHRQPSDLRGLLDTGWGPAHEAAQRLVGARRVYTVGIGTSYHAALVGAWLLRAAGSDARAVSSFDFGLYSESADLTSDDAVIVMAHSGVKTYSNEALARAAAAGATRISIGSLTAVHEGSQQVLRTVERERSAAFTASHLAAMTVLAQIATELGEVTGAAPAASGFRAALQRLPDQVADVLARATGKRGSGSSGSTTSIAFTTRRKRSPKSSRPATTAGPGGAVNTSRTGSSLPPIPSG